MSPAQTRIHQAALRLFAEKGSNQITVSELAQAAGIARGTIYNNLESPDLLFQSVAARTRNRIGAASSAASPSAMKRCRGCGAARRCATCCWA